MTTTRLRGALGGWRIPSLNRDPSTLRARADAPHAAGYRLVTAFTVSTIVGLLAAATVACAIILGDSTAEALHDAQVTTELLGRNLVRHVDSAVMRGDPSALARLDATVREEVLREPIVRVKLWASDGRILYSDEPRLIGQSFPQDPFTSVVTAGQSGANLSDLSGAENAYERSAGKLFEVYVRLLTPEGESVTFEAYHRAATIDANTRRVLWSLVPAFLVGFVVLELVQVPLAWSMGRRLWRSQEDRLDAMRSEVAASEALNRAYAHLEALFETVPTAITVYDRDLRLVRINAHALAWSGADGTAQIGAHISEAFPRRWPAVRGTFERALAGETFTREVDRRALGERTGPAHLALTYAPVRVNGVIDGVVVVGIDNTERVARQRALATAYAEMQATFNNVPVALAAYDQDLRLTRMNQLMADWCQVDANASIGRHVTEVLPPAIWRTIEPLYERTLRGEPTSIELHVGANFYDCAHMPIRVHGAVVGVNVAAVDTTERATHEHELTAAYAEVQSLFHAVEDGLRFRDDIIHFASHELRTPLTSIIGFTERWERAAAASSHRVPAEHREELSLVRQESERMSRTLDVILDLVGLDAGLTPMEQEPVAVIQLVRRQARMLRQRYPGIRLHENIEAEPIVDSDGDRITQVVTNLLENAAKYAGRTANITVRVRVESSQASGNQPVAVIDVEDDGPGIPFEEQEAIFQRRYRGHKSGGTGGLGLGLYLSRTIAIRLGGSLTVSSKPGEGATFTLTLPLAVALEDEAMEPPIPIHGGDGR